MSGSNVDEDCLYVGLSGILSILLMNSYRYLNIWSPPKTEVRKPVLVFIYGGGFETGTTAGMDGSRLANREDAVVVVPA
jgi:para-nitrobenzyl esterase